jgi:predicted DsbA family dithiol-disulfide isomerase
LDERALRRPAGNFGSQTLQQAIYEARRSAIDDIIDDHLLAQEAKTLGIESAALLDREVTQKVQIPTDVDITQWYTANRDRTQGAPLDQVRTPIQALLFQERTEAARREYLDSLRKKAGSIRIMLEPTRYTVADAGRPAKGPAGAPIQIVEFSDFECPFCLRAFPTVDQVLKTYGNRVRLVYRHYPLPNHPHARPAAEASACAAEQGKFWEYHDRLFGSPGRLGPDELKQHAAELGLDTAKFNTCVDTHKFQKDVDEDIAAADAVGVTGTPAFFINGRSISGAMPFETFKQMIDEELARAR